MRQEYNFYAPPKVLADGAALPDDEALHFIKSLRGRSGDVLKITDGCGKLYSASAEVNKSAVVLLDLTLIEETVEDNLPTLAVGLLKHTDRMEWLVEKAVEIGVKEIVWLLTEKSTRYGYRHERMERIAIAAMKQSGRLWLPKINGPVEFSEWIINCNDSMKFIAHCAPDENKIALSFEKSEASTCAVLIGPESDFSEEEIHRAIERNFRPVSLGGSRLRSETAALFSLSLLTVNNDRML